MVQEARRDIISDPGGPDSMGADGAPAPYQFGDGFRRALKGDVRGAIEILPDAVEWAAGKILGKESEGDLPEPQPEVDDMISEGGPAYDA